MERLKYIAPQRKNEWLQTTFQISGNFLLAIKSFKLSIKWSPAALSSQATYQNPHTRTLTLMLKHVFNLL
jgi:hypothetical protein